MLSPLGSPSAQLDGRALPPRVRGTRRALTMFVLQQAKQVGEIVKQTASKWLDDKAPRLAASLALYTLMSLAPLLILAVAVAGLLFGEEAARGQIAQQLAGV